MAKKNSKVKSRRSIDSIPNKSRKNSGFSVVGNNKKGNSFGEVSEMIETAKELAETQINVAKDWFTERGVDYDAFLEIYERYHKDENGIPKDAVQLAWTQAFGEDSMKFLEDYRGEDNADATDEDLKKLLIDDAISVWKPAAETQEELKSLENDFIEFKDSNAEYLTSKEFDMERENKLNTMRKRLEAMEAFGGNPTEVTKMRRVVKVMSQRFSPDYLFEDLLGTPDVTDIVKAKRDRLVRTYFEKERSNYTVGRFKERCKQLKVEPSIIFKMLNIEENYLEDKYHVFNNFYIFSIMVYTNYNITDIKDVRELKYPVQCLLNLVYNKFYSEELRDGFIAHIRRFLDMFEEYYEVFNEHNQLHPTHPRRIQKDAERAAMEKELKCTQLASEFPEEAAKLLHGRPMAEVGLVEVLETLARCRAEKEAAEKALETEKAMEEADARIAEAIGEAPVEKLVSKSVATGEVAKAVEAAKESIRNGEEPAAVIDTIPGETKVKERETRTVEDSVHVADTVAPGLHKPDLS